MDILTKHIKSYLRYYKFSFYKIKKTLSEQNNINICKESLLKRIKKIIADDK